MKTDEQIRAELDAVGKALEVATVEQREFAKSFFPKLAAIGAGDEGQATLVSVLCKQSLGFWIHFFPSYAARQRLAAVLEEGAAQLRAALKTMN